MTSNSILAYTDPMSGAVVFQLLIACVAGTIAFFRNTISAALKRVFGRSSNKPIG